MTSVQTMTRATLSALLAGTVLSTFATAQSPYNDPYRSASRAARVAYLESERAKAATPINYTFPIRSDLATAYNAAAYSPQYQYSQNPRYGSYSGYGSAYGNRPYSPYASPNYVGGAKTAYRPTPLPNPRYGTNPYTSNRYPASGYSQGAHHTDGTACPLSRPPAPSTTTDAYYRAAAAANARTNANDKYYVGSTLAGPPKVYPSDEPLRNLFRYLIP